jgi:hypothetical protein
MSSQMHMQAGTTTSGRRPQGYLWFLLLPILTAGFGTFALPLWALQRTSGSKPTGALSGDGQVRPQPVATPTTLVKIAAGLAVVTLVAAVLFGVAPVDETGAATGPLAGLATVLALALLAAGVLLALRWRPALFPPVVPPHIAFLNASRVPEPVAAAQARRQLREQYRQLTGRDPMMASEIGVGQPDGVDDGGLIDVNSAEVDLLRERLRISEAAAQRIVEVREDRGGLRSADELVVYADLPVSATDRVREYGVFL